jgi:hypothetical protein
MAQQVDTTQQLCTHLDHLRSGIAEVLDSGDRSRQFALERVYEDLGALIERYGVGQDALNADPLPQAPTRQQIAEAWADRARALGWHATVDHDSGLTFSAVNARWHVWHNGLGSCVAEVRLFTQAGGDGPDALTEWSGIEHGRSVPLPDAAAIEAFLGRVAAEHAPTTTRQQAGQ